jgi:D-aminopeptidase
MALRNLITDVEGVRIGHAEDAKLASGVTAIVFDEPVAASVDVRGGGSGTRETALLDPAQTVEGIDAIALSGGSAFGLDAASGVQALMREKGRGFRVRDARVPIVPGAILFDLLNGGDKGWERHPPYRELGYDAARDAGAEFSLGSVGAGMMPPAMQTRNSRSGAWAQVSAPPPPISKAGSARHQRAPRPAPRSARWPWSTRSGR